MLLVRDRKDPRRKSGNNRQIPLLDATGYDACATIEEQRRCVGGPRGRIFPYNGKSVGTAFRRQCRELKIKDLHFHDLRHEGTSRLFEAGVSIQQGAPGETTNPEPDRAWRHAGNGCSGFKADAQSGSHARRQQVQSCDTLPQHHWLPHTMAVRLQPNHPTDDRRGILASVIDGLMYGCGDAVIGINWPPTRSRSWRN